MLHTLHLVRHGEVHNPDHVVYADLPGFTLSDLGMRQAQAATAHLADRGADVVVASPLERAVETAAIVARGLEVPVTTDERLTEWRLSNRWAGVRWDDLPERFPGELEAYLATPDVLPFSPEPLADVADRGAAAIAELGARHPGAAAVVVSHMDPVQALRLHLVGRPLAELGDNPPGHATVITLVSDNGAWREASVWTPE